MVNVSPRFDLSPVSLVRVDDSAPATEYRESDQALPAGVWRWRGEGGSLRLERNTAAAGDFSALSETMRVNAADQVLIGTTAPAGAEKVRIFGAARIDGKLTVTGVIDPTALELSDPGAATNLYIESRDGQTAAVSAAGRGRIRYNGATNKWQISENAGAYADIGGGGASGWTDDGAVVRLTTAGDRVGIGTAAPGTDKLHVAPTVTTDVALRVFHIVAATGDVAVFQVSGGATGLRVLANGRIRVGQIEAQVGTIVEIASGFNFRVLGGQTTLIPSGAAQEILIVQGAIAQTANLIRAFVAGGSEAFVVFPNGNVKVDRLLQLTNSNAGSPAATGDLTSLGGNLQFHDGTAVRIAAFVGKAQTWTATQTYSGADLLPAVNNTGNVGTAALRWALIRGVVVTSGDLVLESADGRAKWTISEERDRIVVVNNVTGRRYRMVLEETA